MEVKTKKETASKKDAYFISKTNEKLLKACIEGNNAALLIGETGTGKTTVIREYAKEQGQTLVRISLNGSTGIEEILGKWLIDKGTTVWQDGILTMALRRGYWVVMDEINAALPEVLFVLHSLLDDDRSIIIPEKDNEIVRPAEGFRFFATMNPPEEYAGTKDMNKALVSRFTAVINVDVLTTAKEIELLVNKGADKEVATNLVAIGQKLRELKKKDYIFYFCSTRDLVQCAQLISSGVTFVDALIGSIANKMSIKEFEIAKGQLPTYFKLSPAISSMSFEDIIKKAENYDSDIKEIRTVYDTRLKEKDDEIVKIKKEAEGMLREKSDEATDKLLKKLLEVAKQN